MDKYKSSKKAGRERKREKGREKVGRGERDREGKIAVNDDHGVLFRQTWLFLAHILRDRKKSY